jgi:hypothetical protein
LVSVFETESLGKSKGEWSAYQDAQLIAIPDKHWRGDVRAIQHELSGVSFGCQRGVYHYIITKASNRDGLR